MTEQNDGYVVPAADLGEAKVVRRRDWLPSLIWLIPAVAALVGISLVVNILWDRGTTIEMHFDAADGREPGKTAVKFKDVQIGLVQSVELSDDQTHVNLKVQLNKNAKK